MKPAADIKRLINQSHVTTSSEIDERILGDGLSDLGKLQQKRPAADQPNIWRTIMKSRITKLAAAAAIIVGIFAGINHFGARITFTTPVFADVIEQIYNARTVMYKQTFQPEARASFTTEIMIMEPGLMRSVLPHGDVMINDFARGRTLHLMVQAERALVTQRVGRKRGRRLFNYLDWLEHLHEDAEFIGQEEIDGQMTDVFVSEVPFERATVWVNPETSLPVKVEQRMVPNVDTDIIAPRMHLSTLDFGEELKTHANESGQTVTTGGLTRSISISSGRGSGKGIQQKMTITMHDFAWDEELGESLFSLEPPEGYTIEEKQFDVTEMGENDLIYALSFWAEMSDGMFPSRINDLGDPNEVRPLLIRKFDGDGDPAKKLDQAMKETNKILKGLYFSQEKKVGGRWGYAGEGVRLGEADTPICWWKPEGSDDYRVIYGDLSVGDSPETPGLQDAE
jgi:hypothetical protein